MKETKWLTIAEASLLASGMGLDRTHKTIRSWCRKLTDNALTEVEAHPNHSYWKSRARIEDKYAFLREN